MLESPLTRQVAVSCPGLHCSLAGITWHDSLGRPHDLTREARSTPSEIALKMRRSTEWVLREIRAGRLYPVVRHNLRYIEVYHCAIDDYYIRMTAAHNAAAAKGSA